MLSFVFWHYLKQQPERAEKFRPEQRIFQAFLATVLVVLKNCKDHTHSFQSAVLMHEFHVLTSSDIHVNLANKWPSIGSTREKFATFFFALSYPDFDRKKQKKETKKKNKKETEKKKTMF